MFSNLSKKFALPRLTVRDICAIGMLLAITALLAIFFTFRIGNTIKIPLKFISVFVASVLYGPWIGGFVGACGDILNVVLAPSGAWIPALTLIEFLCGFVYGVLFYRLPYKGISYLLRVAICAFAMLCIDLFLASSALIGAGIFPSFSVAFGIRLPAGILKAVMQAVVLALGTKYIGVIEGSALFRERK